MTKINNCLRCGHIWRQRSRKSPQNCPECHSPYWDKPRRKIKKEEVLKYIDNIILIQGILVRQTEESRGIRDEGGIVFSARKILDLKNQKANPFEIAAVIYEEFTRKHFFHEGNKRIANILADAELIEAGYITVFDPQRDGVFVREVSKYQSPLTRKKIIKWLKERSGKIPEKYRKKFKQAYILSYRENGKNTEY